MQAGTLIADKYRVERVIGRGGMGVVVEATHLALQTRVALKFLDAEMINEPTAVARFSREARALAALKGDHICRVLDFGINGPAPFIVMELLIGTDLARLSKIRVLDVATASVFIKQACVGLAEAHAAQIIHRDLKPGNLFLTRRSDGSPLIKILDFGVATAPAGSEDVGLTGTSNVVGSPGYMSPEQFRSSRTVDARTDVWSLGVILYKLVTGTLPFSGEGFAEFALSISRDPVPPLPNVHPKFQAIVSGCLEKDVEKRFPNVTVVSEALTLFASEARSSSLVFPIRDQTPDPYDDRKRSAPPLASVTAPVKAQPPKATLLGTMEVTAHVAPAPEVKPNLRPTVEGTAIGAGVVSQLQFPSELTAGSIVGEYKIERKIGQGGMGVVYAAVHPLIGKKAAIKVISAELGMDPVVVQRFVQEARSVNQIGHPNIVDVFAFGKLPDGRNYFVMEHLQGESLRARITRMFIPLGDAIQILDEIAGALEAAHEMQIVHRDLKPDHVFLSQVRGNMIIVKLLDFGIAKLAGDGTGIAKTHTGEMIGTPAYLSPEQARGKDVDHRTDIYALGCMMFEIVTGRLPFMGESPMDTVMMHLTAPPRHAIEIRKDLPPQLDQLIFRMMDKSPELRPSLAEMRDLFAELVVSGAIPIEHGTGATFRSELSRGSKTPLSNKAPAITAPDPATKLGQPAAPVLPTVTPTPTARRRGSPPSDAPTAVAFSPGPRSIEYAAEPAPTKKSRKGLVIGIVGTAFLVPIVTIAIAMSSKRAATTPGDAAPAPNTAVVTPTVDAGPVAIEARDASVAPLAPDAAVAAIAMRDVQIQVNVPTARIEIDGASVASERGVAKLSLADGPHALAITAAGHVAHKQTLNVSTTMALEIRLDKVVRAKPTASTPTTPVVPKKPDDGTIDPFAP